MAQARRADIENDPWSDSSPVSRPIPRWQKAAGWLVLVVVVLAATATIDSYVAYGTPDWWSNPGRLHWCGRDYSRATGTVSRANIPQARLIGDKAYPVVTIGRLPQLIGRPIIASVTPAARRREVTPSIPCAMAIYLESLNGRYVPYVIQGGP